MGSWDGAGRGLPCSCSSVLFSLLLFTQWLLGRAQHWSCQAVAQESVEELAVGGKVTDCYPQALFLSIQWWALLLEL